MTTKLPIYEAEIIGTEHGIFAMSFVDVPANESNFVALARSAARPVKMSLDKQKQILTGVVLVPDQMIYRHDALGEYYLRFTAHDIEKIRDKMLRTGVALANTTHQHEKPLRGNYLVECWTVADGKRDKAAALGLGELPKGTLVASYKVSDPAYWNSQVLGGKVKGFSIEGLFNFKTVNMAKTKTQPAARKLGLGGNMAAMLKSMAAVLEGDTAAETKDLASVASVDETGSGTPVIIFTLQDGTEIDVDSEGFCTIDEAQAPAGDHLLDDGNTISIGDDGFIIETTDEPEAAEPDAAAAALARQKAKDNAKKAVKMFAAPKAATGKNAAEIAKLKAQIAKLEKTPSASPAKPTTESNAVVLGNTSPAVTKGWQRAAAALRARNERNA